MSWRFGTQEAIEVTATSSGVSDALDTRGDACLSFTASISNLSGTGVSIQFDLEASDDTINWNQVHSTRQLTTIGAQRISGVRITAKYYRYRWTLLGSTPSATFLITTTLKNYLPIRTGSQFRYNDLDMKSENAVSTLYNAFSNTEVSISVVRPEDTSTVAGIIIQVSEDGINWHNGTGEFLLSSGETISQSFSGNAHRFYRVQVATPAVSGSTSIAHVLCSSTGGA